MIGRKEENGPQGSGYSEDGTSFTLTKTDQHAVCSWNGDVTPKSSEDVSVTLRSQQGGEGVGVAFQQNERSEVRYIGGNVAGSLAADPGMHNQNFVQQGGEDNPQMNATLERVDGETVEGMCAMRGATMVRRLTPKECERLQGFPDDWTSNRCILELDGNQWKPTGKVEEQKDGPRYRQMGNAVSVPVAEYLGHRMAQAV
jgi:site-specific DNA-cytosine methylase